MRTTFLLLVLTLTTFNYSQVLKTINIETAGTLSTILTEDEKSTITDLTVSGTIDARDIKCIRDQIANITNLDLSNSNITAYNGPATSSATNTYLSNVMPRSSFYRSGSSTSVTNLTTIILPKSLTSIGDYAFYLCTNIKSIYIGNSITNIGEYAFEGCSGLNTLIMGNSVTSIQQEAFGYCSSLKNITFSENISYLGSDVFYNCSLEKVTLPNSLTTLSNAFRSNSSLTEITLPASITNFDWCAFQSCPALRTIYCLNPTPPTCYNGSSLAGAPTLTSVYVPAASVNAFKNAPIWGTYYYSKIKAILNTATHELIDEDVIIYSNNSDIVIDKTTKGEKIRVLTLTGQLIHSIESLGELITLPALKNNIYIVKTATKTVKIII